MTAAGYPVPAIPSVSVVMTRTTTRTTVVPDMHHLTPRCPRRREASRPGLLLWTLAISRLVRRSEESQRGDLCLCPLMLVIRTRMGGARVSQTCLERALLMLTRTVRIRVHRRTSSMADKDVNSG